MAIVANLFVGLAMLATLGLGWSLLPASVPHGPDRGVYGIVCIMFQLPQAGFLTIALLLCVVRAAPWPAAGGFQYVLVIVGQIVLNFTCFLCVVWYLEGFRGGDLPWLSRGLVAVPFCVAGAEMFFAVWVMNRMPAPTATLTRAGWAAFATAGLASGVALASVYVVTEARADRTRRVNAAQARAARQAEEAAKAAAADRAFSTITPTDPLTAWLPFTGPATPEARRQTAFAAIARRPNLAAEVGKMLAVDELNTECQALTLIDELPPIAVVGLLDPFRVYGDRLCAEITAALADPDREARRNRLDYADTRATLYTAAARGLHRAGVDVRPELKAVLAAVGTPDEEATHNIVRVCEHYLQEFAAALPREG